MEDDSFISIRWVSAHSDLPWRLVDLPFKTGASLLIIFLLEAGSEMDGWRYKGCYLVFLVFQAAGCS